LGTVASYGLDHYRRWRTASIRFAIQTMKASSQHLYEVRPRPDHRGVDLISAVLPFGRLWYADPDAISNAIDYAKFFSRSHDAVIRVYDDAGNVIEMHEHAGEFKEWSAHHTSDFE
jgi:hypothetical protein